MISRMFYRGIGRDYEQFLEAEAMIEKEPM
jgi:hypothetical protein